MSTIREILTELEVKVAVLIVEVKNAKKTTEDYNKRIDMCRQEGRIQAIEDKVQPLHDAAIKWQGAKAMLILICSATGGIAAWAVSKLAAALGF